VSAGVRFGCAFFGILRAEIAERVSTSAVQHKPAEVWMLDDDPIICLATGDR
jgi:hypothetical protein